MVTISEADQTCEIVQRMVFPERAFLLGSALIPLLAPYELIIRPQWSHFLNPLFVFAAFVSLGATVLSALLILAAIASLDSRLLLDKSRRSLVHWTQAPVLRPRTREFPLDAIQKIEVERHDWTDGWPTYSLIVTTEEGVRLATGSFWSRADADALRTQVLDFLAA